MRFPCSPWSHFLLLTTPRQPFVSSRCGYLYMAFPPWFCSRIGCYATWHVFLGGLIDGYHCQRMLVMPTGHRFGDCYIGLQSVELPINEATLLWCHCACWMTFQWSEWWKVRKCGYSEIQYQNPKPKRKHWIILKKWEQSQNIHLDVKKVRIPTCSIPIFVVTVISTWMFNTSTWRPSITAGPWCWHE